jgi:hypothetical protein
MVETPGLDGGVRPGLSADEDRELA